jgi:hypothetical protein
MVLAGRSKGWVLVAGLATVLLVQPALARDGARPRRSHRAAAPRQAAVAPARVPTHPPAAPPAPVPKVTARAQAGFARALAASPSLGRGQGRFRRTAFVALGSPGDGGGAYLTLSARGAGTTFYVNNRPVGTGPVVRHRVDEGVHRIEAVGPRGARVAKWLAVSAGDDRQLSFIR